MKEQTDRQTNRRLCHCAKPPCGGSLIIGVISLKHTFVCIATKKACNFKTILLIIISVHVYV